MHSKVKSFTLSELLVTMIITVIVVGLAFSVLNLVRKQISSIQENYNRTTEFAFFRQRIWVDFNKSSYVEYDPKLSRIVIQSDLDTVYYEFKQDYVLRNKDTLSSKLIIEKVYFQGSPIPEGIIDAIAFKAEEQKVSTSFFVFKDNDATFFMNQDGF